MVLFLFSIEFLSSTLCAQMETTKREGKGDGFWFEAKIENDSALVECRTVKMLIWGQTVAIVHVVDDIFACKKLKVL